MRDEIERDVIAAILARPPAKTTRRAPQVLIYPRTQVNAAVRRFLGRPANPFVVVIK